MKKTEKLEKIDVAFTFVVIALISFFTKEFPLLMGLVYAGISAFIVYIFYLLKRDNTYTLDVIFSILVIVRAHYYHNKNLTNSILLGIVAFLIFRGIYFILLFFKKEK